MSEQEELVPWLRPKIERDLSEWRDREAHFLAAREREGDYLYFEARERAAQLETELAVLDEHAIVRVGYKDSRGIDRLSCECATCGLGGPPDSYPCQTVRLLGCGYRFRPGYREAEWKP